MVEAVRFVLGVAFFFVLFRIICIARGGATMNSDARKRANAKYAKEMVMTAGFTFPRRHFIPASFGRRSSSDTLSLGAAMVTSLRSSRFREGAGPLARPCRVNQK